MPASLARLRQFIIEHHDLEELRTLCFDLDARYDELGGEGLSSKARELILCLGRRRQLDRLLALLEREHPDPFARSGLSADPAALELLYAALSTGPAPPPYTPAGGTLPVPPEPFVGRAKERDELAHALRDGRGAVHTLSGMGGVGKTALAARVVHDLIGSGDFPGGVLWLSLEAGPTADTLWTQVAAAYGYPPSIDAAGTARAALNHHRPLLVIDNAESAPAVARALLDGRGAATVLLTTRDRTVAAGYGGPPRRIDPLDRPAAVELFLARAGAGHDPALVGDVCELLGDLPLAVNLAAGYVTSYDEPLAGYLALLRGTSLGETLHLAARRDMSVPATLDLTHDRLDDDAQLALAVLALDGGESSALPAVAAGAGWADTALARRACNDLVRRSLVTRENATVDSGATSGGAADSARKKNRYRLHPLVRRYAIEKQGPAATDAAGLAAIRTRLTGHYLAYARAHKQPTAADYDALQAEHLNILAAMDRAYRGEQWAQVRRFAWALCDPASGYLGVRGYWGELRARLEQAVRAAEVEGHQRDAAAFSWCQAYLLQNLGELDIARQEYERTMVIFDELGERTSVAGLLHELGRLAQATGDHAEARRLYRASLDIKEELGNRAGIASTLHELGRLAQATGDHAEARRLYRASLDIEEELGNRAGIASTLGQLANLAKVEGDQDEAERFYRQAIVIGEELGDVVGMSIDMFNLALLCEDQGRLDEALPLLERVVEIDERVGLPDLEQDRCVLEQVREKLGA